MSRYAKKNPYRHIPEWNRRHNAKWLADIAGNYYGYRMGVDEAESLLVNIGFVNDMLLELHRHARNGEAGQLAIFVDGFFSDIGGGKCGMFYKIECVAEM